MQILILLILLRYIFLPKNRISDEIRIFDNSPEIISSWWNNLLIRGFLPLKARKKIESMVFLQHCNDCMFLNENAVFLAANEAKSDSQRDVYVVSNPSSNVITYSYSRTDMQTFCW